MRRDYNRTAGWAQIANSIYDFEPSFLSGAGRQCLLASTEHLYYNVIEK